MKKIALFLLLLLNSFCFSQQQGTISVEWNSKTTYSFGDYSITIPQFNSDNFVYDNARSSLIYSMKIPLSQQVDENSLQISNVVYESIDASKLGDLSRNNIPTTPKAKLANYIARDNFFGVLTFAPIIKADNGYKKITSLTYSFSLSNTSNRNNSPANSTNAITNSVLSSGAWYRFYVEKSGVYRISKSFLNELGFSTDGVDPKKIKIYGSGGKMVPLKNSTPYPNDLEENAIQVIGETDGVFDNSDYILLYAEGMDNWSVENQTNLNLYCDRAYYYITSNGGFGKRMAPFVEPTGASTVALTSFDDYQFHEVDLTNIGRLGRYWFGESFNLDDEQEFKFSFPNIVPTATTTIDLHVGGNSFVITKFDTTVNAQALPSMTLAPVVLNSGFVARDSILTDVAITTTPNYTVKLHFDDGGVPTSKGYLDYIGIKTKSSLKGFGKQFRFQYNNTTGEIGSIAQYQFNNAAGIQEVWDITDIYNTTKIANTMGANFSFKANLNSRKYIAFEPNDTYTPLKESQTRVANQNLKGTIFLDNGAFRDVDYLILTPGFLLGPAERLANFHRNYAGLNVKVVSLETIYQEFASGKQDIGAIRNFIKYVYENASAPSKKVKYVNLFGDASFDFKDRISNNTNIVPIYHSLDSWTNGVSSFCSDDFFCYMDPNEGDTDSSSPYGADIAVGRMIVSSLQQADEAVNKIIEYHDLKSYGSWRNNFVSIADDADQTGDGILQFSQNDVTDQIAANNPFVNTKKIFLDSYQQESTAGGDRYPKAKEDIQNAFEKGALVFNYLGHGGEDGLTGERIWDKLDGLNFFNQYRYPLFITITCDFSRFDNPLRPTAGEYTYWNPR